MMRLRASSAKTIDMPRLYSLGLCCTTSSNVCVGVMVMFDVVWFGLVWEVGGWVCEW